MNMHLTILWDLIGQVMRQRISAVGITLVLCMNAPATAAMYKINNPGEKISNPADKVYNPATKVNNPASNIYNPASRMNDPNPLSPPTQPVPPPTATEVTTSTRTAIQSKDKLKSTPAIPHKSYYYKTVRAYINAAKKAFSKDDYIEFIAITEDALRRIKAGTLKASKKSKQKLFKYKIIGYELLEKESDLRD
jgi:hypothetical protein